MKINLESLNDKRLFVSLLKQNILTFKYVKLDGKTRTTRGTLHPSGLPSGTKTNKTGFYAGNNAKEEQITYFDFTVNDWRSPKLIGQTITVENIEPIDVPAVTVEKKTAPISKTVAIDIQLLNIYEKREVLKRKKKDYVKIIRARPSKRIRDFYQTKIDNLEAERKTLRKMTKQLTEQKKSINL